MKTLHVLTWNVAGIFSSGTSKNSHHCERKTKGMFTLLKQSNAQLIWLAEAFDPEHPISRRNFRRLRQLAGPAGKVISVAYNQAAPRLAFDKTFFNSGLLISKVPLDDYAIVRLGDYRNAIRVRVNQVDFYGIHLDDRSDDTRLAMSDDVITAVTADPSRRAVVMGDFNATFGRGFVTRGLRFCARLSLHLARPPSFWHSVFCRVAQMTGPRVMRHWSRHGFVDTDHCSRPTVTAQMAGFPKFFPSLPLLQLDHIMVTDSLRYQDFKIWPKAHSDHCPISAKIVF